MHIFVRNVYAIVFSIVYSIKFLNLYTCFKSILDILFKIPFEEGMLCIINSFILYISARTNVIVENQRNWSHR